MDETTIIHDSINGSHRWTDGVFAYVWHEGTSLLAVGSEGSVTVSEGSHGVQWVYDSLADVQRTYVRSWGSSGPVIYGESSSDLADAWTDPADVAVVVRELADSGMTDHAFLLQFDTAIFLGPCDGQAFLRGEAMARQVGTVSIEQAPRSEVSPVLHEEADSVDLVSEIEAYLAGQA